MEIEKTKKRIITLLQQIGGSTLCAEICKEVAHENYEKALELSEKLPIFGYGHKEKLDKVKFLLQSLCSDDAEVLASEDGDCYSDGCDDCDGECRCEDETPQVDENVFDREVLEQPTDEEEELPSEIYVEESTDCYESTEQEQEQEEEEEYSDDGECSDEE